MQKGLMRELASGFRLLMDPAYGLITFDSLPCSAALLGLGDMFDDYLRRMLAEGGFDEDDALSEMEFCVLMHRLCLELMEDRVAEARDLVGQRGGPCVEWRKKTMRWKKMHRSTGHRDRGNCALCTGLKKGHHSLFACSIQAGVMICVPHQ
ncbi:calcium-binding protein PBP1-like [Panicum virgatum]|uniref:calcium-binding protein PBP1-like n=1 Tax=Panicum virgatum TaxID=38727 RepID=UPI0019D5DEE1|nr:calcium-binding protein PBP1-like [Panicum virgatum]